MDVRRLLFGVEAVVLIGLLACATAESVGDVSELAKSEIALLDTDPMAKANAEVARLDAQERAESVRSATLQAAERSKDLAASQVELEKLQATAEAKEAQLAKLKDPVGNKNLKPADPGMIATTAQGLSDLKLKIVAMQEKVQNTARSVEKAQAVTRQAAKDAAAAEEAARVKAAAERKAQLLADAKAAAAKAAKDEQDKKNALQAEKERQDNAIKAAQKELLDARKAKAQTQRQDTEKIDDLELTNSRLKKEAAENKVAAQKASVAARAAKFRTALKNQEVETAKEVVSDVSHAKSTVVGETVSAEEQERRGRVMMNEAKEMLELNKERISSAQAEVASANKKLHSALHQENLDKASVEGSLQTIAEMAQETTLLEEKRKLVRSFGETLRQKAGQDGEVAKNGLAKAQLDHKVAQSQFAVATKEVQKLQKKIDEHEADRQKSVQAVLGALENDDVGASITAGENHVQLDQQIRALTKLKQKYDIKCSTAMAQMNAAKKEEASAMDLQLAANKQLNQAKNNDAILEHQEMHLMSLAKEQKARKQRTQFVLDRANNQVKAAESALKDARTKYESRLAASRYLSDVKMPLAKKLLEGGEASKTGLEAQEQSEAGALTKDQAKLQQAVASAKAAEQAEKDAEKAAEEAKEKVKDTDVEQEGTEKKLKNAQAEAKAHVETLAAEVSNAQDKLTSARHPTTTQDVMESNDVEDEPTTPQAKHAVVEMDAANAEVEKAHEAYQKAFGISPSN
jgi:hypothetical protein